MKRELPAGVFDVLERALATRPAAVALKTRQGSVTYAALDTLADKAAGAWEALGVRRGQRVAVSLANDLDIVAAFHGAMRLGAVWVGVNRVLAPPEKAHQISDSQAAVVLADEETAVGLANAGGTGARVVELQQWRDAVAAAPDGRPGADPPDPRAPAAIAYTSGTTGLPKGAVHSQAALLLPGAATVARRSWGPELVKGDWLPLTILNMMVLTTLLTAQAGATAVIMDSGDVHSIVDWIRSEAVTVWNGPPAQLHTMVSDDSINRHDLATLD
ncbi:MAG: class I adenylate-forming enzyme family protein, partial [Acidimicrobiales bacterium]